MSFKPEDLDWLEELEEDGRIPFEDPAALDELRRNALETVGLPWAIGILYGVGFTQGMLDGVRLAHGFSGALAGSPPGEPPTTGMLFTPGVSASPGHIGGTLPGSVEARLHRSAWPASADPVCWASAGYAAGWYSALLDGFWLVREHACLACGDGLCRFEGRPARDWLAEGDAWAESMAPYIDYEEIRQAARSRVGAEREDDERGMLGGFDPASPAAHVWGPVGVLPYSGIEDTLDTVDAIRADLGADSPRVILVDLTGARIDGPESGGLLRLIDALEERDVEVVLVGLRPGTGPGSGADALRMPLQAENLERGIALAFQLAARRRS